MDTPLISISAHVIGRVQGVGFRDWTRRQASDLGLSGWVANEADGSVRAVFTGPDRAVEEIATLLRTGPPAAEVHNVVIVRGEPEFSHSDFKVID